eukprot:365538-Chlamydomonas_euryale.AAC.7
MYRCRTPKSYAKLGIDFEDQASPIVAAAGNLLFAEGLVGLGGVVGRPRSTWRDRALAALRPVLTSRLVWWGGVGMEWLRTMRSVVPFLTAPSSLLDPLSCCARHRHTPCGSAPSISDSDSESVDFESVANSPRLAALDTGTPLVDPLPVALTLTDSDMQQLTAIAQRLARNQRAQRGRA